MRFRRIAALAVLASLGTAAALLEEGGASGAGLVFLERLPVFSGSTRRRP